MYLLLLWEIDNVEDAVSHRKQYKWKRQQSVRVTQKLISANTNRTSGGVTVSGQKQRTHDGWWLATLEDFNDVFTAVFLGEICNQKVRVGNCEVNKTNATGSTGIYWDFEKEFNKIQRSNGVCEKQISATLFPLKPHILMPFTTTTSSDVSHL